MEAILTKLRVAEECLAKAEEELSAVKLDEAQEILATSKKLLERLEELKKSLLSKKKTLLEGLLNVVSNMTRSPFKGVEQEVSLSFKYCVAVRPDPNVLWNYRELSEFAGSKDYWPFCSHCISIIESEIKNLDKQPLIDETRQLAILVQRVRNLTEQLPAG